LVSQALFMFAHPRYAACVEIPLAAFISILGFIAINEIAALISWCRRKQTPSEDLLREGGRER
jgi:hypothetical protein